ncbi:bifunctional 3-deoxy-7-phosphoheptulonate synthase/chorismate mutase [bacterium BMS3Abin03]|nr:bifunctional 3-deoxy-7-phosphoheptulonate synthase/chorismate mutase [bacterium BMS3Abin03]
MNEAQHLTEIDFETLTEEESRELLNMLRSEVDNIDAEIVELLNERAKRAALIGKIKKFLGRPNYSPQREKEIIKKLLQIADAQLGPSALMRIYERIIDEFRAIQRREREKEV